MTRSRRRIPKRPLAQAKGTHQQSTNEQRLMAPINALDMSIVVFITLIVRVAAPNSNLVRKASISQTHQSRGSLPPVSLAQQQQSVTTLLRGNLINTGSIRIFHRDFCHASCSRETATRCGLVCSGVQTQTKEGI
jgi:hypothetical protein